ncbi:MAG: hypothetical protein P1P80_00570 [ANME-2 cluster archaeon]|nr:hypothetical protein [ANME-2 cluster archaeon]
MKGIVKVSSGLKESDYQECTALSRPGGREVSNNGKRRNDALF